MARDAAAFAELIRLFERTALSLAYAVLGEASAAGDVVQDAFLKAWQRMGELNEPERFGAWLGRMVRNLAIDARRKRPIVLMGDQVDDIDPSHESDPSSEMSAAELRSRVNVALAKLDEVTRSAVVMRYYQNLSSREIGKLLEMSPAAIDMRLSRARIELKERLAWADPATNGFA